MKFVSMILAVLLVVAGSTLTADAAFSASVDVSPQLWTWYDTSDTALDEHHHTRMTMALQVPLISRFSAEVASHSGEVFTGFEGGLGFRLFGCECGMAFLGAIARHHQWSIETDQPYTVQGLGYGLSAGLSLFRQFRFEYVTMPSGVAQAGGKEWDVSGRYFKVTSDLIALGPLRVRTGYVQESFDVKGTGSWSNSGVSLGAAIQF